MLLKTCDIKKYCKRYLCTILSKRSFHKNKGNSDQNEHNKIRNDKSASAIFVNEVGKAANISESYSITNAGKQIVRFRIPLPTFYFYIIII